MIECIFAGPIPTKLQEKALTLINEKITILQIGYGWKKVTGLNKWFSYKLNTNYRVLHRVDGVFFVCNHDRYSKKIRAIKKQEL